MTLYVQANSSHVIYLNNFYCAKKQELILLWGLVEYGDWCKNIRYSSDRTMKTASFHKNWWIDRHIYRWWWDRRQVPVTWQVKWQVHTTVMGKAWCTSAKNCLASKSHDKLKILLHLQFFFLQIKIISGSNEKKKDFECFLFI